MVQMPIVLFLFNRPALTAQVFAVIRQVRPAQLFLIADGPRLTHPRDPDLCAAARQVVATIDWPCTVHRLYSATNLGCGQRIASGLDWVFAQVEAAIILEDDILPDPSFFPFCQELLTRYHADARIAYISGYNALGGWAGQGASYFTCRHGSIWGWATWRRAWQHYDFTLDRFRTWDVAAILARHLADPEHAAHQAWLFAHYRGVAIDTWDIQWTLSCLLTGGLCLMPSHNLVKNLGFQTEATHTIDPGDMRTALARATLPLPLVHPTAVQLAQPDAQFDRWVFLLTLMTTYKDAQTLRLWQRLLDKTPTLTLPGLNAGITHILTPLRHPAEACAILSYWQRYSGGNARLQRLLATFQAMATQPATSGCTHDIRLKPSGSTVQSWL